MEKPLHHASEQNSVPVTTAQHAQPDLVCFSHLRWHFVTQRPQHLLTLAAENRRVFFWEEPVWHDASSFQELAGEGSASYLEEVREQSSLWVLRPHLMDGASAEAEQRTLLRGFMKQHQVDHFITWYYTAMARSFSMYLRPAAIIYDCMDELQGFLGAPPELARREQELLGVADVVFTGGLSLYEAKREKHHNVHAFPSSIDADHFSKAHDRRIEAADQALLPHPKAGFYGVIDERLDLSLLAELARLRPQVNFIVIGPVVKIDPAALPQAQNIHYLGSRSYSELPTYLAGWDVAIMPFAMNEATRFISPTKTPEYLAAGKTVVSTPIHDVVHEYGDLGLVSIADTPAAFASAIDLALRDAEESWRRAVSQKLALNSWRSTWRAMQEQIDLVLDSSAGLDSQEVQLASATHGAPVAVSSFRLPSSLLRVPSDTMQFRRAEQFDYIVVGAGFAGSVLAERLATQLGKRVLVVDKREHIAGNAYDFYNADGLLVHKYGPHIFHTNSDDVVAYLSRFTSWRSYEHRVLSSVDGKLVPVPINIDTINQLYSLALDKPGMEQFLADRVVKLAAIRTSEDIVLSRVGRELYEKFFRNYTRKQWGLDPSQLDAGVAGRIPVRFDRDDRYFTDTFQAMPLQGYTRMFERLLDQQGVTIRTGVDYVDVARSYPSAKVIYTGPIDEYFDFRYGPLPYRSLEFKHETHDRQTFQQAPVINYPNDHEYTRVTEFKYLTGQDHPKTSVVYEYPRAEGDPYYPIPRPENAVLFSRYKELADRTDGVTFCGRLANYKYFNMDQVVAQALSTFRLLAETEVPPFVSAPVDTITLASKTGERELA